MAMLIVAMVLAAGITHAYEQGKARTAARWEDAKRRAEERGAARERERLRRAAESEARWDAALSAGPRHVLWWVYAAGWVTAGAISAVGAGAVGAYSGAIAGSRSGYRVGLEAGKTGRRYTDAWREWRQKNPRASVTLAACERCHGWVPVTDLTLTEHGQVCGDCLPVDTRDNDEPNPEPEPHTTSGKCRSCGRMCPRFERDADGWCRSCVDAAMDVQNGHGSSPCARCGAPVGHRSVGAGSTPSRIVCHSCAPAEQKERQPNCFLCARPTLVALLDSDGLCPTCGNWERSGVGGECNNQCSNSNIDPDEAERQGRCPTCGGRRELITDFGGRHRHVPCRDCYGTGRAGADNTHEPPGEDTPPTIRVNAERVYPDPEPGTTETPKQKEITNTMSALMPANNGNDIDSTGEGYTDTVQSLDSLARLMDGVQGKVTDLNDNLTANSLDTDTLTRLSELTDQIETVTSVAKDLHRHVQDRHNPMAEATASAGGSQNVATKTWYDHY